MEKYKWKFAFAASVTSAIIVAPFAEASTYIVEPGDSLYKIAQKHQVSVNDLKAWNNLTSDNIYVSQSLIVKKVAGASPNISAPVIPNSVPDATHSSNTTVIAPTTIGSKLKTYRVVKGDTLSKIATRNNTTVAKLKEWNTLSSDLIKIGQVLIVKKDSTINSSSLTSSINLGADTGSTPSNNTGNGGGTNSGQAPTIDTPNAEQTAIDNMIKAQLAKEVTISKAPSAENLNNYNNLIALAKSFIGVPYVFGGITPAGFDCSGFISYVYNEAGIKNTRRSSLDYFLKDTTTVTIPIPGDLVFFKNTYIPTVSHMGIYLGNGEMIHAGSKGIEITKLSYSYWKDRQVAFKRFNNVK